MESHGSLLYSVPALTDKDGSDKDVFQVFSDGCLRLINGSNLYSVPAMSDKESETKKLRLKNPTFLQSQL